MTSGGHGPCAPPPNDEGDTVMRAHVALLTTAFLSLGTGMALSAPGPLPGGSSQIGFQPAGSLAHPRGLHTATLLDDGRVLIVGGVDASSQGVFFVPEGEVYDPLAGTFTATTDPSLGGPAGGLMTRTSRGNTIAVVRIEHTATKLQDGRVLVCGGYGAESINAFGQPVQAELATAFVFDPTTNTFAPAGKLGTARRDHSAV